MNRSTPAGLQEALASTFALYRDLHVAHWNVEGPMFPSLHKLLEDQYTEVWEAMDVIAERIRACGEPVARECMDGGAAIEGIDPAEFLPALARGHRELAAQFQQVAAMCAETDIATADVATQRVAAHEKHAWMLEATARGSAGAASAMEGDERPRGIRGRLRRAVSQPS
jgi:starvation-inducible DNA-binding protein